MPSDIDHGQGNGATVQLDKGLQPTNVAVGQKTLKRRPPAPMQSGRGASFRSDIRQEGEDSNPGHWFWSLTLGQLFYHARNAVKTIQKDGHYPNVSVMPRLSVTDESDTQSSD